MYQKTIDHLKTKNKVLFLTTSNRWSGEKNAEKPKSTRLAYKLAAELGPEAVTVIEVPLLTIYPCEGNVSTDRGNTCGLREALLQDTTKNPSGLHRCWVSLNNPDDELWKISQALFMSDAVVLFGSIRWGQLNSIYQKLIERLTWIENRHSTLGEENIIANIEAGLITVGQNWHGVEANQTQQEVLKFFGFQTPAELSWHWQYTTDAHDEAPETYQKANQTFRDIFSV